MRIGFDASVASGQPGGTGTYAVQLLNALIPLRPEWSFYLYFHDTGEENPLLTTPEASNVHRLTVPARTNAAYVQLQLPRRLAHDAIDVYHSPGYFLPLRWRGKKVVTIHDLNMYLQIRHWMRREKLFAWLDLAVETPVSAWLANRVIVPSESAKREVGRILRVRRDHVRVIPEAPDTFFDQAPSAGEIASAQRIANGAQFILFVGILSPQKNLDGLLAAFAASKLAEQGIRLVLVGADHEGYARTIRETASRLKIADSVVLAGYVTRSTLRALYAEALCLVLPSYGEGFGLPMVEAMARGTPILAADRQALPEVLGDGGSLFNPDDVAQLAALLQRVATDAGFRDQLVRLARERRRAFSWERTATATAAVYEELHAG